ncbi:uncharacterized protein N7483_004533 [Penicillium malachiteum]|uniref:uncharacterized protein n=1 Tax=Penicillium malachiteum TaxID=1324776 RepID=UPI002546AE8A|nr:uncharacterized protein N7483_004533 [Penicillium malachiteum]KAJ5730025.1 hypothetical protein N7483_004533 [Penicillium malachiteum]
MLDLEITDLISAEDPKNLQIFTVKVIHESPSSPNSPLQSRILLAKLYEPLYFNDASEYLCPCRVMDRSYTHETAAYSVLSEFQGREIPRYYGSYTFDIPVDTSGTLNVRSVRLILTEYIRGTDMAEASPYFVKASSPKYVLETRQQIMKKVVEFESVAFTRNILLKDLSPRNVILPDDDPASPIFIDFGDALLKRLPDDPICAKMDFLPGQYISPLLRWDRNRAYEFVMHEWVDWDWEPWVDAEFANTAPTITPRILEVFGKLRKYDLKSSKCSDSSNSKGAEDLE